MKGQLNPAVLNEIREAIGDDGIRHCHELAEHIMDFAGGDLSDNDTEVLNWPEISDADWLALSQDFRRIALSGILVILADVTQEAALP